jgi:O-antigen/teichoic acid export membrane protein
LRRDSLADSIVILMLLTLVQPVVGFVRGILFCRWLDPEQLGQWDIALGFLTLAAPLVVLGIPGSFGRYVEYYRQRHQVRRFVLLATLATLVLSATAMLCLWWGAAWFSRLIFGAGDQLRFVRWLALALVPLVAFGFATELLNAFRLYRLVSGLQLLRSVSFLLLGGTLLFTWRPTAISVVAAYATASLMTAALGTIWIVQAWRDSPDIRASAHESVALKVMPFALWVWVANIVTNLFQIVDRYLIVHCSGLAPAEALEMVGNYHSARVVPLLVVTFAMMLSSILLPHLSNAWEEGRRRDVAMQTALALKLFGLAMTAGAALFLVGAPLLFGVAFAGKYAAGQEVLPWTLAASIWCGLATLGQTYLWCRERAGLGSVALLLGLVASIVLNVLLLPRYQLWGAVWAGGGAMLVMLACVYLLAHWLEMQLDAGVWLTAACPVTLVLGPLPALLLLAIVGLWAATTTHIFSQADKAQLALVIGTYCGRLRAVWGGGRKFRYRRATR